MFCRRLFGARCTIPFADDTQSCDTCPVTSTCIQSTLTSLSSCINDLAALFSSLRLQLNPTKSEFIWFGSRIRLAKIPSNMRVLSICSADVVRDLGVWLDCELTMNHHISKIVSTGFYHLRRLWQLRDKVTQETMKQLVTSLVPSRIDYCNVVPAGLPASTIATLLYVLFCVLTVGRTFLQHSVSFTSCW